MTTRVDPACRWWPRHRRSGVRRRPHPGRHPDPRDAWRSSKRPQAAFPGWIHPIVITRLVLTTVGSLLTIVLFAIPAGAAWPGAVNKPFRSDEPDPNGSGEK